MSGYIYPLILFLMASSCDADGARLKRRNTQSLIGPIQTWLDMNLVVGGGWLSLGVDQRVDPVNMILLTQDIVEVCSHKVRPRRSQSILVGTCGGVYKSSNSGGAIKLLSDCF